MRVEVEALKDNCKVGNRVAAKGERFGCDIADAERPAAAGVIRIIGGEWCAGPASEVEPVPERGDPDGPKRWFECAGAMPPVVPRAGGPESAPVPESAKLCGRHILRLGERIQMSEREGVEQMAAGNLVLADKLSAAGVRYWEALWGWQKRFFKSGIDAPRYAYFASRDREAGGSNEKGDTNGD
jgi:hypothetical protein